MRRRCWTNIATPDAGKPQARAALGLIGNKYTVDWSEYLARIGRARQDAVDMVRLKALGKRSPPTDGLETPSARAGHHAGPRAHGGGRSRPRLGLCRDSRVCEPGSGWVSGAPHRTGQRARHFLPPHCRAARPGTGRRYVPLQHLATNQPAFTVRTRYCRKAVMGFEYGFSTTEPHCLTIWEGQFGDFCNGAQVIIDQFISSGEAKWGAFGTHPVPSARVRGSGPRAFIRAARSFLQLCAEYNMQVCVPSTPAQMFHLLPDRWCGPCASRSSS